MSIGSCETGVFESLAKRQRKEELQSAARVARSARNSLRQLLAGLTSDSQTCDTHRSSEVGDDLEGLRTNAQKKLKQLQVLMSSTGLSGLRVAPYHTLPRTISPSRVEASSHDLVPRLILHTSPAVHVRAVAISQSFLGSGENNCTTIMALLLSTGLLEIWKRDAFSWHRSSSLQLSPVVISSAAAAFSCDGPLLWIVASDGDECSETKLNKLMLFDCTVSSSGQLKILDSIALPGGLDSGPVPLLHFQGFDSSSTEIWLDSAAVALSSPIEARIMLWSWGDGFDGVPGHSGFRLFQVQSFEVSAASMDGPLIIPELWPLPDRTCVALWLQPYTCGSATDEKAQGGELQIRACDSGECIAWLPFSVGSGVLRLVVPPQESCPENLRSYFGVCALFVLVEREDQGARGVAWDLVVASYDPTSVSVVEHTTSCARIPHQMNLMVLNSQIITERCLDVLSNENILGCRTAAGWSYLFDWQHQRLHTILDGWKPIAVSRSVIVLVTMDASIECGGAKLVFLESQ